MKIHRIIQIGAGGIGQPFGMAAAKILSYSYGVAPYYLFDGDKYEDRNAPRQSGNDGEYKAETLALRMEHATVTPYCDYIEDEDHMAGIIATNGNSEVPTVIAICVDNDATRNFIYQGVQQTDNPCFVIDMANEEHHGDVICMAWVAGQWGPNDPFEAFPQLKDPEDRPPQAYCEVEAPNSPQLITTNMQAACIGARMLWALLTDHKLPFQVNFNHATWDMRNPDAK